MSLALGGSQWVLLLCICAFVTLVRLGVGLYPYSGIGFNIMCGIVQLLLNAIAIGIAIDIVYNYNTIKYCTLVFKGKRLLNAFL